ncbi:hypothetical protein C0995_013567 [Termitomyces sp. Mi166|nr:hypothetical protein C0995_013567 [Termitomyces sp. Mi166\
MSSLVLDSYWLTGGPLRESIPYTSTIDERVVQYFFESRLADKAFVNQELTPIFENFRMELDKVTAQGDTAMYEALELACNCLVNFRRDLPRLRRRIIVVSDGQNTSTGTNPMHVGRTLQANRIIVDSVQVGDSFSNSLWAFSAATVKAVIDLETMITSADRPPRPRFKGAFNHGSRELATASSLPSYPIDIVTIDQFPKRTEHPKLIEGVKDLRDLVADPHPQIDVYVNDVDISFLKVVIEAPSDVEKCPYKGGCFLLTCELPADFPRSPPDIRFVTFILHPNVSKQGKVCVAELSRLWSSDITLKEIFSLVYGLLLEPDLDNPLDIQASLKYYDDDGTFVLAAAKAVASHASKSRNEWRTELDV